MLLCVLGSIVAQFVQDNDTGNYLRVLLPFLLFLLGYLVACRPWSEYRIAQFEKALFVANVISLLFTFVYGIATSGDLEDVRFRIISVTLLGLQGVLLHEFVVAKRFSFFTVSVFALSVIIELLSVTRSLLVGTVLLFLIAMALSAPSIQLIWRDGRPQRDDRRGARRRSRHRGREFPDRHRALDAAHFRVRRNRHPARIQPRSPVSPRCAISTTR